MSTTGRIRMAGDRASGLRPPQTAAMLLLVSLLGGCHPAAPPPPPPGLVPPRAPVAPPTARWVDAAGPTKIVGAFGGGTVVLLGGRRAMVMADGRFVPERAPLGEPLTELVLVPGASGPRLAGMGESNALYRFDDPVGPGLPLGLVTRWPSIAEPRLAAGPGVLGVLVGARARFVDLDTGALVPGPPIPDLPIANVTFRSLSDGAVAFRVGGAAVTSDGGATYREGAFPAAGDAAGEAATTGPLLRWIEGTHEDPLRAAALRGVPAGDDTALAFAPRSTWASWEWPVVDPGGPGLIGHIDLRTGAVRAVLESAAACRLAAAGDEVLAACDAKPEGGGVRVFRVATTPALALGETLYEGEGERLDTSPGGGALIRQGRDALVRQRDGRWARIAAPEGARTSPLADGRLVYACVLERACPGGVSLVAIDAAGSATHLVDVPWEPGDEGAETMSPVVEGRDGALRLLVLASGRMHLFAERAGQSPRPPASVEAPEMGPAQRGGSAGERRWGAARILERGAVISAMAELRWTEDDGRSWSLEKRPWPASNGHQRGCMIEYAQTTGEIGGTFDRMTRIGWGAAAAPVEPPRSQVTLDVAPPRPILQALVCKSAGALDAPAEGLDPRKGQVAQLHTPPYPLLARASMQPGGASATAGQSSWTLRWIDPAESGARVHTPKSPVKLPADARLLWAAARGDQALFAVRSGERAASGLRPPAAAARAASGPRPPAAAARVVLVRAKDGGPVATVEPERGLLPLVERGKDEPPSVSDWMDVAFGGGADGPVVWRAGSRERGLWIVWAKGPPRSFLADTSAFDLAAPRDGMLPVLLGSHRTIYGGEAGEQGWAATRLFALEAGATPPPDKPSPWTRVKKLDGSPAFLTACAKGTPGDRFRVLAWRDLVAVAVDGRELVAGHALYEVVAGPSGACAAAVTIEIRDNPAMTTVHADLEHGTSEAGSDVARTTRLECALQPIGPPPDPHFP